ncbi:MAG: NUDIX hydrolase [Polyangiaceae bacterium]
MPNAESKPTILPPLPPLVLDRVASREVHPAGAFVWIDHVTYRLGRGAAHPDGSDRRTGATFDYDMAMRRAVDAVVVVAHFLRDGEPWVFVRSSVRPPVHERNTGFGQLWELPAGLVEPGETPVEAARRELFEELGFAVDVASLETLGPPSFPAPALIGERHFHFHVAVDPTTRTPPEGDGSPLEEGAEVSALPLRDLLVAAERGELPDAKTELGLRRMAGRR